MARCPFAQWHPITASSSSYTSGPFKIVHHTTEGRTAESAFAAFAKNRSDPHFTVDATGIWQHLDTAGAARSLRNDRDRPTETNRASAIQIEVVGFAHLPKGQPTLTNVARLCRWIEKTHGVARAWPNGPPVVAVNGKDPGGHNRNEHTWLTESGHYGHCHVPENTHWDPGYTGAEVEFLMSATFAATGKLKPRKAFAVPRGVQARRSLEAAGATPDRAPRLEAIAITLALQPGRSPATAAADVVARAKLGSWRVEVVDERRCEFELLPPRGRVPAPGSAWEATYRLRAEPDVAHAEPLFEYTIPEMRSSRGPRRAASADDEHDPATRQNFEWSLEKANVVAAWGLFAAQLPGAGVVVGHPDTGYTEHPELADPARLLSSLGFDFADGDSDATDVLEDRFLDNPGHGTGTGSVIVSNRYGVNGSRAGEFVSGVAPFASLIPIRATETVALFSMRGLRRSIDHAVSKGAQVISISLGGPLKSEALRQAVRRALDAGTIVLAAAGNKVHFVVFPAAYEEAIAVAASTIRDVPWKGSCRGDAVDITAPGASVWRAQVKKAANRSLEFTVGRGSGTSFAVATTAGIAALWLSFHGWAALERRYGAPNLARVFKSLLQRTCRKVAGWDTENFGPGIVDAAALLRAPLPEQLRARKLRDPRRAAVAADATGFETIMHMLPDASRAGVETALAELLNVPDRELPSVLQDVGDELAFQLVMDPSLHARLALRAKQPARARTRRQPARARGRAAKIAPTPSRTMMSSRLRARMA